MSPLLLLGLLLAAPDRSSPPPVPPAQPMEHAEPERHRLGQVEVLHVRVPRARRVEVRVIVGHGMLHVAGWPTPAAQAAGWLQDAATEAHDPPALAALQDLHDLEVVSWVGHRRAGVTATMPHDALEEGLDLLAEVLLRPAYPRRELRDHRLARVRWLQVEAPARPSAVAGAALTHAWFPPDHPYGARPDLRGWRQVRRWHLHALHQLLLDEAPVAVLTTGDVDYAQLAPLLGALTEGLGGPGERAPDPTFEPPDASRLVAVDTAGAAQALIRLRLAAPPLDHPDEAAARVLEPAVSGSFLSRLNRNLREERGLTYGVGSSLQVAEGRGHLTVSVDVPSDQVRITLSEIRRELAVVAREGLDRDERHASVQAAVGSWNSALLTADSAARLHLPALTQGRTLARSREILDQMHRVDRVATAEVADRWWGPEQPRVWVIVGDRAILEPQLDALELDPFWITPEQALWGTF